MSDTRENRLPDLTGRLRDYVEAFNARDEELYRNDIANAEAFAYLKDNTPLLDCPDKELETTYYFRWWTLRKHWKTTPAGHILTEFLPPVGWAGPYNSINCPVGHHLREARWLRDEPGWLWEYVRFWLDGRGNALAYSMWFADSLEACFALRPDETLLREFVPKLDALYRKKEESSLRPCGLYWSNDGWDGMEYSISGSGIRPTLNSYLCGDAFAISRMAASAGMDGLAETYRQKGERIRERMDALLWDGDFYRTIPCGEKDAADWAVRPETPAEHRVRELTGYLPWYFHLPDKEKDGAFSQLLHRTGFCAPYGLTTAEQRHPGFLSRHSHECLWNGYVWPFATSQTLTAAANAIRDHGGAVPLSTEDYYRMLRQYALSHRLTENGETRCWIDEDMDPFTGRWYARDVLERLPCPTPGKVKERGKDYNHSTFCDLVLSGLLGIHFDGGRLTADPILPESWDHFMVAGLTKDNWTVLYDKDGTHYGLGPGLRCFRPQRGV